MKEMIFWGATGQAKVLRECLPDDEFRLVALFDNNSRLDSPFDGVPLFCGAPGFESWWSKYQSDEPLHFLVAIGGDKGRMRLELQEQLEERGLVPLIARHRTAFIAQDARIGSGSQILAQAAVCVGVVLGRACIINTGASVDHECQLEDGVHVCPGARLAGCVHVERGAMIGSGAIVLPRLRIGEGAVVGAGAVVTTDVAPHAVVAGNPAHVLKRKKDDEQSNE